MVTHTGDQELSKLSRRCLDKIRSIDIIYFLWILETYYSTLFVDFLAF